MNKLISKLAERVLHLSPDLTHSQLFDETTFYNRFLKDLKAAKKEIIIESPYITTTRMFSFLRIFEALVSRKVKIYVITRNPEDHDLTMRTQAEQEIRKLEMLGVQVLLSAEYSHRKLAIIDRQILWEGSLNILSQSCSREIMRRIESKSHVQEGFDFINLGKYIY